MPNWSPKVFISEDYDFSSPREAGGFASARICQIRGKIRGKFPFSRLNPGKSQSSCVFDRGLRFSSPYGPVEFHSTSNVK